MSSGIPFLLYDSFASQRFGGNVAAILLVPTELAPRQMQSIAKEVCAPTTGFLMPFKKDGFRLEFYTPLQEIQMCGHVVIAAATALIELNLLALEASSQIAASFTTKAGETPFSVLRSENEFLSVQFGQQAPRIFEETIDSAAVEKALHAEPDWLDKTRPIQIVETGLRHLIVPLSGGTAMASLRLNYDDLHAFGKAVGVDTIALISTEVNDQQHDVHVRDICAPIGDLEEAASGTTNAAVAAYLAWHGIVQPEDRDEFRVIAEQGIEMGRPSRIVSQFSLKNGRLSEVKTSGSALLSLKGEFYLH